MNRQHSTSPALLLEIKQLAPVFIVRGTIKEINATLRELTR